MYINAVGEQVLNASSVDIPGTGDMPNMGTMLDAGVTFNDMTQSYTFDEDGTLKNIGMHVDIDMSDTGAGDMSASLNVDMAINSLGETVVIQFPDFTGYTEISA
jgi:hypothetical protein